MTKAKLIKSRTRFDFQLNLSGAHLSEAQAKGAKSKVHLNKVDLNLNVVQAKGAPKVKNIRTRFGQRKFDFQLNKVQAKGAKGAKGLRGRNCAPA